MGEYAIDKTTNQEVKIGTCENMYFLRYEDRFKVQHLPGNTNPATDYDLRWRLPFPDEDHYQIGVYEKYDRGYILEDFPCPEEMNPGNIQLRHESGMMINATCYHGEKLPEGSSELKPFWNGRNVHFFELAFVKNTREGMFPIVRCRHCGNMWRSTWAEVLPLIQWDELRHRLTVLSYE